MSLRLPSSQNLFRQRHAYRCVGRTAAWPHFKLRSYQRHLLALQNKSRQRYEANARSRALPSAQETFASLTQRFTAISGDTVAERCAPHEKKGEQVLNGDEISQKIVALLREIEA
jgi:hypothetical protein